MELSARRSRREQRRQPHAAGQVTAIVQPLHTLPVYDLVNEERVAQIHDKSMQILEQAGIAFYDEEARQILRACGARGWGDCLF